MEISYSSHRHLIIPSIRLTPSTSGGRTFFLSFLRIVGKSAHFFSLPMPLKNENKAVLYNLAPIFSKHIGIYNVFQSSDTQSQKLGDLDPAIFNNLVLIFSNCPPIFNNFIPIFSYHIGILYNVCPVFSYKISFLW